MAAKTGFAAIVNLVQKELFVRPVIWGSTIIGLVGLGAGIARAITPVEGDLATYLEQNEMNIRTLMERELHAELNLLLSAKPDQIPVFKRHVWQMAAEVEKYWNLMNSKRTYEEMMEEMTTNDSANIRQFRSQALDIYWTLAEQRGKYTPEERKHRQIRQLAYLRLPPPIPSEVRPFPFTNLTIRDASIQPPAPDAPRSEFVKYYALRYQQVDL